MIIVSVSQKDECNSLKCRAVAVGDLGLEKPPSRRLFKEYVLRWPDFIEFDELNCKIITKHSQEEAYRVWSLNTYQLQFVLSDAQIAEFKICHGVMLLLYQITDNKVPMTLINVHTGTLL